MSARGISKASKPIVFLGAGRITTALVAGLRARAYRARIVVCDRNPAKLRQLCRRYGVHAESDPRCAAAQAGMLIVAVRPPDVLPLVAHNGAPPRGATLVSLAAGVTLRSLERALPAREPWIRAMPSPAVRTANGLTALAFSRGVPRAARRRVRELFELVGTVLEIPERGFDAFSVVYSTSQGYHALAARIRAARRIGLDAQTAFVAARHSLLDALRDVGEISGKNTSALDQLIAAAATPGGLAAKTLEAQRAAGYDRSIERAFRAGLARARTVARPKR